MIRSLLRQQSSNKSIHKLQSCVKSFSTQGTGIPYSDIKIGVPKETYPLEKRVAISPANVKNFIKEGFKAVNIESDAGASSFFSNEEYVEAGATIIPPGDAVLKDSDLILKVRPPTMEQVKAMGDDKTLISYLYPGANTELVEQLKAQKCTAFAMDCIPRTLSRGQTFDALSSQANISGYRAVLEASHEFGRFFAGQMTAAGKVNFTL